MKGGYLIAARVSLQKEGKITYGLRCATPLFRLLANVSSGRVSGDQPLQSRRFGPTGRSSGLPGTHGRTVAGPPDDLPHNTLDQAIEVQDEDPTEGLHGRLERIDQLSPAHL